MTTATSRQILFSPAMICAILDGRKTQTRRIAKPESLATGVCPYGKPGDYMWVRETWAAPHQYDDTPPRLIPSDARIHYAASEPRGGLLWRPSIHMPRAFSRITLRISSVRAERLQDISDDDALSEGISRLGNKPADRDGLPANDGCALALREQWLRFPVSAYRVLWEAIHGARAWDKNPLVWVLTFDRVEMVKA